jgi:hypothetical protein
MILTEQEAQTKRCQESFGPPLSQDGMSAAASPISVYQAVQTSPMNCIGSACMAWRWVEGERSQGMFQGVSPPTKGYCGKAGRP